MDNLEFLRQSAALFSTGSDTETILVGTNQAHPRQRLFCSCMRGKGYATCTHAQTLLQEYATLAQLCNHTDILSRFNDSVAAQLLGPLIRTRKPPASWCCLAEDTNEQYVLSDRAGRRLCSIEGDALHAQRLFGRLGVETVPQRRRAHLINRCRDFHLTDTERALRDSGVASNRMAEEDSFWYRLAYHLFRECDVKGAPPVWQVRATDEHTIHLQFSSRDHAWQVHCAIPAPAAADVVLSAVKRDSDRCAVHIDNSEHRIVFAFRPHDSGHVSLQVFVDVDECGDRPEIGTPNLLGHYALIPGRSKLLRLDRRALQACAAKLFDSTMLSTDQAARLIEKQIDLFSDEPEREYGQLDLFGAGVQAASGLERLVFPPVVRAFDSLEFEPVSAGACPDDDSHQVAVKAWYRCRDGLVEMVELDKARREGRRYLYGDGILVDLRAPAIAALVLAPTDAADGGLRLSRMAFLQFRESGVALRIRGQNRFSDDLRALLEVRPSKPWLPPAWFASRLRDYQVKGAEWMLFLYENRFGGLLCDEMGLGKTHQALALLAALHEQNKCKGVSLVVCPTSVMGHWEDLAARFAPALKAAVYHGGGRDLDELVTGGSSLLITSYGIMRNDSSHLWSRHWEAVVFDEIQNLKNRATGSWKAAADCPASIRLGLTGTPVENSLSDVKSLFDIVLPGYLGSDTEFVDRFVRPVEESGDAAAKSRFRRMIHPFLLRRLKRDVALELPEKIEDVRSCELGPRQKQMYRAYCRAVGLPLREQLHNEQQPVPYMHVLGFIQKMKQLCDHPRLAGAVESPDTDLTCPKFDVLCELIDESLDSGEKAVVFSQYLGMIDIIVEHLRDKGVEHAVLTGSTTNRTKVVRAFGADETCKVFVCSLLAGGTGIDLTAASVVIHYDRWWTAAREDQATDRVHRIGQTRGVQVFKFITKGTVEERIERIIARKRELAADALVIDSPEGIKAFSREELLELLEE